MAITSAATRLPSTDTCMLMKACAQLVWYFGANDAARHESHRNAGYGTNNKHMDAHFSGAHQRGQAEILTLEQALVTVNIADDLDRGIVQGVLLDKNTARR